MITVMAQIRADAFQRDLEDMRATLAQIVKLERSGAASIEL